MDIEDLVSTAKRADADSLLIVLEKEELGLTRFANSEIHQNIIQKDQTLVVRAVKDKRVAVTVEHGVNDVDAVKNVVNRAISICPSIEQDPDYPPPPEPKPHQDIVGYYERTAKFGPVERGRKLNELLSEPKKLGITASGFLETRVHELSVVTKSGIAKYFKDTSVAYEIIAQTKKGSTGYELAVGRDVGDIDFEQVTKDAINKAIAAEKRIKLDPGTYTVVLEPPAVGHLLLFLAFMGFGGKTFLSGFSFMKLGEQIMGENVTIVDDPLNPKTVGFPFDYEGTPKRKIVLVENGIAKNVVFDRYWGHKAGKESTGHALRPDNKYGPYPKNMVMVAGNTPKEKLLEGLDNAIWINRLWYVNFFNPMRTQVTGTTRDATLLVKDGKFVSGVETMRFLISILETCSNIAKASSELTLTRKYSAYMQVPYLVVEGFKFIS